mmetsp:Transcript_18663/g.30565  ORF Transcript_18663/g.30565 Transcript_18663/m.30565 type:complete len:95 (-) Transcript_18663:35-319(-)
MNKTLSTFVSRGQTAGHSIFEGFNDGGFTAAVCSYNNCKREAECDNLFLIVGGEGSHSSNGQFCNGRHDLYCVYRSRSSSRRPALTFNLCCALR